MLLFLLACTPAEDSEAAHWELGEQQQVVPAGEDALPSEVVDQASNNNLDILDWEGGLYLAFRTAPSHFASPGTVLYVLRQPAEGEPWQFETSIAMGTDLREPRFAAIDGKLFLYFAVLGQDASDFEPQGTMAVNRTADGAGASAWTEPAWVFEDTFIPWRIHPVEGGAQLVGYTGGGEIYDFGGEDSADTGDTGGSPYPTIEIRWLASTDGWTWTPAVGEEAVVQRGGGSETDWVILDDGRLVAVTRNEAGDETGFGSKICSAPADDLGTWTCVHDPKKYDSPVVFAEDGRVWLIGRRNLTESGDYDLGRTDLSFEEQALTYAAEYWGQPKRCSLWEVDPDSLVVSLVLDLPSRGDTCFPSLRGGPGSYEVWNYSSPVDGPDLSWIDGQLGTTYIYRQGLSWSVPMAAVGQ